MLASIFNSSASAASLATHAGRVSALVFAAGCMAAQAQGCLAPWSARFGATLDDQIHAAIRDGAGNVYLGGFENGKLGVESFWPIGDSKGFVEKRAPNGMVQWRREFNTAGIDSVEALAIDRSGRIAVAGRTSGTFPGSHNAGQLDLFAAVLDDDGTVLALTQTGNERPQHPTALTLDDNGAIVVVGYDDVYIVGTAVIDRQNGFLARFRFTGENALLLDSWSASASPQTDVVTGVVDAADGTGDSFISTAVAAGPATGGGIHVRRVDTGNHIVWSRTLSTISLDYISALALSPDGRLYAAGTTLAQIAPTAPLGDSDGFIVELDVHTGVVANATQVGSAGADWIYSLAIDAAGNPFVLGISNDAVVPDFHPDDSFVPFTLGLTLELEFRGAWQADPPAVLENDGMVLVPSDCGGSALIAGSTRLPADGGPAGVRTDARVLTIEVVDAIFRADFNPLDTTLPGSRDQ